jgi:glutamine synthetase
MEPIVDFSGSKLLVGETDGSSFPNGGLRVTHTAAAYTAWYVCLLDFVCILICFSSQSTTVTSSVC